MGLKQLTLLHSNDLHGDFHPESIDETKVGGFSMLSGYVEKVRKEESNVLFLIAGDFFRGSVIDEEYRGISTIELLNMISPDVVTVGNHEFDYGIAHLLLVEKCAQFPIVNCNLFLRQNETRLFSPCHIVEIDGMKILVIGLLTKEVLAETKKDALVGPMIEVAEAAREVERVCNCYQSADVDLTVLLTHIGIEEDMKLAAQLNPELSVDLIIGGHSHTEMEQPICVNQIIIAHAGSGSNNIGRFDLTINTSKHRIAAMKWSFPELNENNSPIDPNVDALLRNYKQVTDLKYERVVTRFKQELKHPKRNMETPLGNLFADIMKESLSVDVMLFGSGSIRKESLGPVVTFGGLKECLPFDDGVYYVKMTGKQLFRVLRYLLREEFFTGRTEFYQVSEGIRVVYSYARQSFLECSFFGNNIENVDLISVGIQGFHFMNAEAFFGLRNTELELIQKPYMIATSCFEVIEEYLRTHKKLDRDGEGRIVIVDRK